MEIDFQGMSKEQTDIADMLSVRVRVRVSSTHGRTHRRKDPCMHRRTQAGGTKVHMHARTQLHTRTYAQRFSMQRNNYKSLFQNISFSTC